ncbi:M4 family metallopeptidase [Myxococcaceae bacterium GXIMD 01537]
MVQQRIRAVMGFTAMAMMMSACTEAGAPAQDKPAASSTAALEQGAQQNVVARDESNKPTFITGDLGAIPEPVGNSLALAREADFAPALSRVAPTFNLDTGNLFLKRAYVDREGDSHVRFGVRREGRLVLGAELRLHSRGGKVFAANTNVRGDLAAPAKATVAPEAALSVVKEDRASPKLAREDGTPELVYWRAGEKLLLVYQVEQYGEREDGTPVHDSVLVNAENGDLVERIPHVHTAMNRKLYDGKTLTTLPGTLTRSEGEAAVADAVVNTNYDHLGTVYACYQTLFGRDSFDNQGAALLSTVHHRVKYVNAFWNGTQMVYGDGDNVTASNLANSLDVTAHELTHAVTDTESDLIYSGESGGLNESMSDIFGAVCEWYGDGKVVSDRTWLIGDDVWTPATPGDALRYMANPVQDGDSLDYYPDYASGVDVHYSSGISNLAFYLLSQGGTHPRAKTTTVVAGIGIEKAARIFYKANVDLLLPSSGFEAAKVATEQAAAQLGYDAATVASVTNAWKAVGVGVPIVPPTSLPLEKGVPVTNQSGTKGQKAYYSVTVPEGATELTFTTTGGTGDADLYVRYGQAPTTSLYDCRPFKAGNEEVCTVAVAQAGTYYVMLNAYSNYSGVSLKVTWKGGYVPISNNVDVTGLSGSAGSSQVFTLDVPARSNGGNNNVHVRIHGGTGNADLYVQRASAPDHGSYDCRDVKEHNSENCNLNNAEPGKYYILVFGAKGGFQNLTLSAMHQ